jgi:hypothetical protein
VDYFFDEFMSQVSRKLRKYLASSLEQEYPIEMLAGRLPALGVRAPRESPETAGVDGGAVTVKLSNGHHVVLARAAAVGPDFIEREFLVDIAIADSPPLLWAYLITVESLAGLKAIEKHDIKVLLADGSLYVRVTKLVRSLAISREFQSLYHAPELARALLSLSRLLTSAQRRGVRLVFVSKDSSLRLLKEHAIFEKLSEKYRDGVFARGLLWYSVLWLRKYRRELIDFYKAAQSLDRESARLVSLLLSQSITDSELLARLLPAGSYTAPMLLGCCDAHLNYRGLTAAERLSEAAAERLRDSAAFRPQGDGAAGMAEALREALEAVPKLYLLYIKLNDSDTPLLVEVPAYGSRMFDGTPAKAFCLTAGVGDVAGILAQQYRDPVHYNTWLWYAHVIASFSSRQISEYVAYIRRVAASADMDVARRVRMALGP